MVPLGPGGEFDLIRAFVDAADARAELPIPLGDDAAALEVPPGELLVVGTDAAVEDVHFRREWLTWEAVGYRATAAALSDLAAMAARPLGVLVSLLLPPELERDVVRSLGGGVGECLRDHGTVLLGGDTSRSPGPVAMDVVVVGSAARPVSRRGAHAGDEVWVTGSLGAAAAAVADLSSGLEPDPRARRRLERPAARLREAVWLAERGVPEAMIDLSDGLAGDAGHLAAASGVRVEIDVDAVPVAEPLLGYGRREAILRLALSGGEDFELLAATRPGALDALRLEFQRAFRIPLTRIGRVREGRGVGWVEGDGSQVLVDLRGWDHFREGGGRDGGEGR